jgi:hypothetical protein
MMDLRTIRHLEEEAAKKAKRTKKRPLVPADAASVPDVIRGIPNLGSYVPPGWKKVEDLFVDKSGLGGENEPAMTLGKLVSWVQHHVDRGYGYGLTSEGQFQVYVGVFEPLEGTKVRRKRRLANPPPPPPSGPAVKELPPPARPGEVVTGTLTREGVVGVRSINPRRCPFCIFDGSHYRDDGSCKCNDPEEQKRLIRTAGYHKRDFQKLGLAP